jgi:hypothetical protein
MILARTGWRRSASRGKRFQVKKEFDIMWIKEETVDQLKTLVRRCDHIERMGRVN